METHRPNELRGNYFALPRFIRKLRGGDATRSEGNWIEAYFTGAVVYLISYFFVANLLVTKLARWQAAIVSVLLLFGVWIAWLILLYLHSLIVKLCWRCGLFTDLPRNRVQSVLMGIVTTAFAAQLLTAGPWLSWIGWLWIVAVAFNLAAALLLALFYDEPH
jgi:hypothetical protein